MGLSRTVFGIDGDFSR